MYQKYLDLLKLVYKMQGSRRGVTYKDIEEQFGVSRRTAERMIKAISDSFPELEVASQRPKRWRLRRTISTPDLSKDQIAVLQAASHMFKDKGMSTYSVQTDNLLTMLRANMDPDARRLIVDSDIELLNESEGFVARPGPREKIEPGLIENLRFAVLGCQTVRFEYTAVDDSAPRVRTVQPYGFLHGTRQYLVAFNPDDSVNDFRIYILAKINNLEIRKSEIFERQDGFNLADFLGECFGAYQERPYNIVWRFNADIADAVDEWRFHRSQKSRRLRDGRVEITFRAGGLNEMAWHLITWGDNVEVVKPKKLIDRLREIKDSVRVPD